MNSGEGPLANLGDLTKPATVLIERISEAVGGIFKPYQMVRVAKAEAEVGRIQANAQIEVSDLHRRAIRRFLEEEAKKQANIEAITSGALSRLDENARPEEIEADWITNFFDKSRIVSDEDMQQIWAKLLAQEANQPQTFSRRTVNLLSDLDKRDAELFTGLCDFAWVIHNNIVPLIFNCDEDRYNKAGLYFSTLSHLETLGLIQFDNRAGFLLRKLPKKLTVYYYNTPLDLVLPQEESNTLVIGKVLLTRAGYDLARICDCKAAEGFLEHIRGIWTNQGLVTGATAPHQV